MERATSGTGVLAVYPYRFLQQTAEFKAIAAATGCELPYVRADWFVATASRPPLYHDLLQLPVQRPRAGAAAAGGRAPGHPGGPGCPRRLQRLRRRQEQPPARTARRRLSGRTGAATISPTTPTGKTSSSIPSGPVPGQNSFDHAGGEIIFHLPNGLQGYLLVDGNGRRLDRAPVEIVSDPKRPDRVRGDRACRACPATCDGVILKADQVRAHVEKNPNAFSKEDTETIRAAVPSRAPSSRR